MDPKSKFFELVKKYEEVKEQYKSLKSELEVVMAEVGINQYLQDPVDGLVYKIQEPKGTYVYFSKIEYLRTKKPDEDKGSLSKSEAQSKGFEIK